MMAIYHGSTEITSGNLKIGATDIQEVYWGANKIWPEDSPFNNHPTLGDNVLHCRFAGSLVDEEGALSLSGSPSYAADGLFSKQAMIVDSNNTALQNDPAVINPGTDFSHFFWLRPRTPSQDDYQNIMEQYTSNTGYEFFLNASKNPYFRAGNGSNAFTASTPANSITYGAWNSIYLEWTGGVMRLRVNDTTQSTTAIASIARANGRNFRFGASAPDYDICSWSMWHRALTAQELTDLHAQLEY